MSLFEANKLLLREDCFSTIIKNKPFSGSYVETLLPYLNKDLKHIVEKVNLQEKNKTKCLEVLEQLIQTVEYQIHLIKNCWGEIRSEGFEKRNFIQSKFACKQYSDDVTGSIKTADEAIIHVHNREYSEANKKIDDSIRSISGKSDLFTKGSIRKNYERVFGELTQPGTHYGLLKITIAKAYLEFVYSKTNLYLHLNKQTESNFDFVTELLSNALRLSWMLEPSDSIAQEELTIQSHCLHGASLGYLGRFFEAKRKILQARSIAINSVLRTNKSDLSEIAVRYSEILLSEAEYYIKEKNFLKANKILMESSLQLHMASGYFQKSTYSVRWISRFNMNYLRYYSLKSSVQNNLSSSNLVDLNDQLIQDANSALIAMFRSTPKDTKRTLFSTIHFAEVVNNILNSKKFTDLDTSFDYLLQSCGYLLSQINPEKQDSKKRFTFDYKPIQIMLKQLETLAKTKKVNRKLLSKTYVLKKEK